VNKVFLSRGHYFNSNSLVSNEGDSSLRPILSRPVSSIALPEVFLMALVYRQLKLCICIWVGMVLFLNTRTFSHLVVEKDTRYLYIYQWGITTTACRYPWFCLGPVKAFKKIQAAVFIRIFSSICSVMVWCYGCEKRKLHLENMSNE
jgi:hypothetical protein